MSSANAAHTRRWACAVVCGRIGHRLSLAGLFGDPAAVTGDHSVYGCCCRRLSAAEFVHADFERPCVVDHVGCGGLDLGHRQRLGCYEIPVGGALGYGVHAVADGTDWCGGI